MAKKEELKCWIHKDKYFFNLTKLDLKPKQKSRIKNEQDQIIKQITCLIICRSRMMKQNKLRRNKRQKKNSF